MPSAPLIAKRRVPTPAPATRPAAFDGIAGDPAGQMSLWLLAAGARLEGWLTATAPAIAARHPFLTGYREAAEATAPGLSPATWPARLAAWERGVGAGGVEALPMARAAATLGLSDGARLAFALAALSEEDARVGALMVDLQGGGDPYPSIETLARVLAGPEPALGAGWDLAGPLVEAGLLVETRREGPRARRTLAPTSAVWDLARGAAAPALPAGTRLRRRAAAARIEALAYPAEWRARLARVPGAILTSGTRFLVLRHVPGADAEEIAAALARAMGQDLLVAGGVGASAAGRTLGAVALLAGAMPFLCYEPAPGETITPPVLGGWDGPAILSMGFEGGLAAEAAAGSATLAVPFPGPGHRAQAWRAAFGDRAVEDFDAIRDGFQLPLGHVRRVATAAVAEAAMAGRQTIRRVDVRSAARGLGREQLDGLADLIPGGAGWEDLVAGPETMKLLAELARRCAHRERLPGHLGTARDGGAGRGVRALFTGPSGTGKTLAARLLGAEIGVDVYRVDLSAVVDKYVGETEKRLHRLLSRAEALDVILLLDEGDGLMARRTDVRSANDRFANLETNFLLQRLESHEGIAVVTTNMPEGIDPAFQRRMDVVVPFPRPGAEARLMLWRRHLPVEHAVAGPDLAQIAARAAVTGGQIRNAVRSAASLALSEGAALDEAHLRRGLERELQKAGAMAGLETGTDGTPPPGQGLTAFATALSAATMPDGAGGRR